MRGRGQLLKLYVLKATRHAAVIWGSINANLVRALMAQRDQQHQVVQSGNADLCISRGKTRIHTDGAVDPQLVQILIKIIGRDSLFYFSFSLLL